jgi:Fe-S oxidoreductase/sulfur relay (sulfurtransferase) DsrC/TusE family protein
VPRTNGDGGKAAMDVLSSKLTRQLAVNMQACVHCGLCFDSCHYYLSTGDPKLTPAYKAAQLGSLYKRRYDWMGRLFPWWVGAKEPTEEQLDKLYDAAFGSCTMCRRCNFSCPMGIDMGLVTRTARSMLTAQGRIPPLLKEAVEIHLETGNSMGLSKKDLIETVEWMEEEIQKAVGDPDFKIPVDKPGVKKLLCLNPREIEFYPLLFVAQYKTAYAAGDEWGVCSDAWDATNFALFSGDDDAAREIVTHLVDSAAKLGAETLVLTECGHGYRVNRWEAQGWYGKRLPVDIISYNELAAEYLRRGRIKLDPTKNPEPVTYHDPCNQARSGGIVEEPRYLLRQAVMDFREMTPHGVENFCCGGGGGALSMSEFRERRLEAGRIKAEQIRATGAKVVATSCHNCIDQIIELSRHYDLGVQVQNVCGIVANALMIEPKVALPRAIIGERPVEVDENGFMRSPSEWSREAAQFLARQQGFGEGLNELTNDHWGVIYFMRSFHDRIGGTPSREDVCIGLGLSKKQFYCLFPGTYRTALRVAGLRGPEDTAEREPRQPALP